MFIPVVERICEAEHSQVTRGQVYRNVSGPYVSTLLRLPHCIREIFSDKQKFDRLAEDFQFARKDPMHMLRRLGLYQHPMVSQVLLDTTTSQKRLKHTLRNVLRCILYSDDAEAQFNSMKAESKKQKQATERRKKSEKAYVKQVTAVDAGGFSLESTKAAAMLQHLQQHLRPGKLYSFPGECSSTVSLETRIAPLHQAEGVQASAGDGLIVDIEQDVNQQQLAIPQLAAPRQFFRIIAPVKQHKFVQIPLSSGRNLCKKDFAVTLHAHEVSDGEINVCGCISSTLVGSSGIRILSGAGLDYSKLEVEALQWKTVPLLQYGISGLGIVPQSRLWCTLNKLISLRAWSADNAYTVPTSDTSALECLNELRTYQAVECISKLQNVSSWVLTPSATGNIVAYHRVERPVPVFSANDAIPLEDRSPWEWLCALQQGGWELQLAPRKAIHRSALAPYIAGGRKLWFVSGKDLTRVRSYIFALYHSQSLFEGTMVEKVCHLQPQQYYQKILQGKISGERLLPIEDGADVGGAIVDDVEEYPLDSRPPCALVAPQQLALEDIPSLASASSHSSDGEGLDRDSMSGRSTPHGDGEGGDGEGGGARSGGSDGEGGGDGGGDGSGGGDCEGGDGEGAGDGSVDLDGSNRDEDRAVHGRRVVHPDSVGKWGPGFNLTWRPSAPGRPSGSWQAVCCFHKRASTTKCTQTLNVQQDRSKDTTLALLKAWCLEAPDFPRAGLHSKHKANPWNLKFKSIQTMSAII